jgi:hypothetical protein
MAILGVDYSMAWYNLIRGNYYANQNRGTRTVLE